MYEKSKAAGVCMLLVFACVTEATAADEWGIEYEKTFRETAKVVDIMCEVTGNCVENCGGGKRQLGLLFKDGKLVPAVKNFESFTGAAVELLPHCGKEVVADGLIIENPEMTMAVIQFVRSAPDGKWARGNRWGMAWSKANGGQDPGDWYNKDPVVKRFITEQGVYGDPNIKE